jgi:hypothetical protein
MANLSYNLPLSVKAEPSDENGTARNRPLSIKTYPFAGGESEALPTAGQVYPLARH